MLANQYACKISGKEMEVIFLGTDIVIYRTFEKSYDDTLILDDINLEVHQGEVIVLVGPSGCGKVRCFDVSTLWNQFRAARSN